MAATQTDSPTTPMPQIDTCCPKCSGTMARGYSIDRTNGAILPTYWISGLPKTGFLGGLIGSSTSKHFPIAGFRCENCGYLELYARKEFKPK
ncbi:hypothetical protein GC163_18865 [bacterium]|nr:hypothetical protein [bacterium]